MVTVVFLFKSVAVRVRSAVNGESCRVVEYGTANQNNVSVCAIKTVCSINEERMTNKRFIITKNFISFYVKTHQRLLLPSIIHTQVLVPGIQDFEKNGVKSFQNVTVSSR
jgi:hypothetical protein